LAQVVLNVNGYELSDQRRLHQRRFVIHVSMYGTESFHEFVLTLCCHSWTPRPSTITHEWVALKRLKSLEIVLGATPNVPVQRSYRIILNAISQKPYFCHCYSETVFYPYYLTIPNIKQTTQRALTL
jgi:hypothetical protein